MIFCSKVPSKIFGLSLFSVLISGIRFYSIENPFFCAYTNWYYSIPISIGNSQEKTQIDKLERAHPCSHANQASSAIMENYLPEEPITTNWVNNQKNKTWAKNQINNTLQAVTEITSPQTQNMHTNITSPVLQKLHKLFATTNTYTNLH